MTTTVFKFGDDHLRIDTIDGEPWFYAADVCKALGILNSRRAITVLAEDQRTTVQSLNGGPYRNVVSESGFYKLAMRCQDRPAAREFQDWVTREVLPAIRRDGGYVAGEEKLKTGAMSDDEFLSRALAMAMRKMEAAQAARAAAEAEVEVLTPKAEGFDRFCNSAGSMAAGELALQVGFTSAQKLNAALREAGIIYPIKDKRGNTKSWRIAAEYADAGYHALVTQVVGPDDSIMAPQLRWTGAGAAYIAERFGRR